MFPVAVFNLTDKNFKIFSVINISLSLIVLFLCQSRGVLFSFLVSMVILIFMLIKSKKQYLFDLKNIIYILIIIGFVVILKPEIFKTAGIFMDKIKSTFSPGNQEISERIMLGKSSLKIFMDKPVYGAGPGSIKKLLQLKESDFLRENDSLKFINSSYAHNDYLQIISETGVIGILLFIFLILLVSYMVEKEIVYYNDKEYIFTLCVFSSVLFILIESYFNFPLFVFPSCMLFYFFLGLLYGDVSSDKKKSVFSFQPEILIILILLPLFVFFIKDIKKITSNIYLSSAIKQTYSDIEKAEIFFKKCILLDSENFYNLTNFGTFYFNVNKYEQSLQIFRYALDFYPYSADIYYNIGMIYNLHGRYKEAINNYKMALHLYPDFSQANLGLYEIYSRIMPDNENDYLIFLYKATGKNPDIINQMEINPVYLKEITFEITR
ncbi:MAG: O-antigen ligase family protein [Candidatus Goldbacteria bacterium]|nr:O-antigen ligase family protein [Candidatus Goldiibacteriota bacterium]